MLDDLDIILVNEYILSFTTPDPHISRPTNRDIDIIHNEFRDHIFFLYRPVFPAICRQHHIVDYGPCEGLHSGFEGGQGL